MNLTPWKLWTLDGKPSENTERIVAVLESVLARDPNHLGANHYYIHAVEASRNPGRALPSARPARHARGASGHLSTCPRTSTRAPATTRVPRRPTTRAPPPTGGTSPTEPPRASTA